VLVGGEDAGLGGVIVLAVFPVVVSVDVVVTVDGVVEVVEIGKVDVISLAVVVVAVPVVIVVDVVGTVVVVVPDVVVVVDICGVVVLLGRVHIKYFCAATPSYILHPNPQEATETGLSPVGLFVQIQGGNCCSVSPVGTGISIFVS
jgi:hypothetical protein